MCTRLELLSCSAATLHCCPQHSMGCRHLLDAAAVVRPSQALKVEAGSVLCQHHVTTNDGTQAHRLTCERSSSRSCACKLPCTGLVVHGQRHIQVRKHLPTYLHHRRGIGCAIVHPSTPRCWTATRGAGQYGSRCSRHWTCVTAFDLSNQSDIRPQVGLRSHSSAAATSHQTPAPEVVQRRECGHNVQFIDHAIAATNQEVECLHAAAPRVVEHVNCMVHPMALSLRPCISMYHLSGGWQSTRRCFVLNTL